MKKVGLLVLLCGICINLLAQKALEDIKRNPVLAGSQSVLYPVPDGKYTPAPSGYQPFYLSHYGRHGSRYNNGDLYKYTYLVLKKAAQSGKLTAFGKDTFHKVELLYNEANGREGDLTTIGAQQHKDIAARMYKNFPEIFAGQTTTIDARSTIVIRSILSMENALQQLCALNPDIAIKHDASLHDMYFLNYNDKKIDSTRQATKKLQKQLNEKYVKCDRLMEKIFADDAYRKDSVDAKKLFFYLFKLATHTENSEISRPVDLASIFTPEELYGQWMVNNAMWYVKYANAKETGYAMPKTQVNLLRNIIVEADSCLKLNHPSATLRYGHDTVLLPLLCLMEIDDADKRMKIEDLAENGWRDYTFIPMACNIQLVFYRSSQSQKPILVKVLRNEKEAHLSIPTKSWPYYNWEEVRNHFSTQVSRHEISLF